ncbi:MAG: LytTR family transcriptional regulator DNA-binding domain-containing protein [Cyclobacteriaceae bacterium]|nr:LytTR family transcriptional regulator DNA-binding domain-containing protein [Cyclobacteriaceae bacterium]
MIKALIIDDEPLARDVIKSYLNHHNDIEVLAECENGFEGVKAINELQPDLIFLDIQMPKISGFEMLELLDKHPHIIFSTAFDNYALKAFEANAADYLLKPYSKERFNEAITKVKQKIEGNVSKTTYKVVTDHQDSIDKIDRIVVKFGNKINIIGLDTIRFIQAQDDYVEIHTNEGKFLKQITMKYLEGHLPTDKFVRTHRSFIANIDYIDKIEMYEKESYLLHLKEGQTISVSRSGYSRLKEVLSF